MLQLVVVMRLGQTNVKGNGIEVELFTTFALVTPTDVLRTPSLVHKPPSCCCEAGSLAISKTWPMVIWSFRNASGTGGMRSPSLMRP